MLGSCKDFLLLKVVMETLTGVSDEAAYVRSEGGWDLGTSEPCKTHWMVKIRHLPDVLACAQS